MPEPKGVHLRTILLVLLVIVAAGVAYALTAGSDDDDAAAGAGSLRVEVTLDKGAEAVVTTIDCAGVDTASLCDSLTDEILAPVPDDRACTMIYGGPQTATVTGTLRGQRVDATFSRTNGCEISRWDDLVQALKPAGIQGLV